MGEHTTRSTASMATVEMEADHVEVIVHYWHCCIDDDKIGHPDSPCERGLCKFKSIYLLWESNDETQA